MTSPVVSPNVVLTHATDAITETLARLWPEKTVCVGPRLPSVTNYVTTVHVGEARFVAKYAVLGVSLVSVVRGVCGPWSKVEAAQRDYVRDPRAQLAQERTQLRLLNAHTRRDDNPLQVPEVIAYEAGVLITAAVDGPSLATELLREQVQAEELLTNVVHAVEGLHRDPILADLLPAAVLARPHTSIADTFVRKFLGPGGRAYRDGLGEGWA
ncbi:MAG: phosphotransferase, partial [Gammaproteobacteria bacterium]